MLYNLKLKTMGVKLNKETSDVIHVSHMKDGQIAEIVNWSLKEGLFKIIKRVGHEIVDLNGGVYDKYTGIPSEKDYPNCEVRILKNGETLTIENNE